MKGIAACSVLELRLRHALPFVVTLLLILRRSPCRRDLPGFAVDRAPVAADGGLLLGDLSARPAAGLGPASRIGLLRDMLGGTPSVVVAAGATLLVQGVTGSQRRFFLGKPFLVAWWGFAMVGGGGAFRRMGAVVACCWCRLLPLKPLPSMSDDAAIYPLLAWAFVRAQVALLRRA